MGAFPYSDDTGEGTQGNPYSPAGPFGGLPPSAHDPFASHRRLPRTPAAPRRLWLQPGPGPGPGRIIFTRLGNGLADICAMDPNGKNFAHLSTSFALEDWGAWSPDTLKIVYQSDLVERSLSSYAMDVNGHSLEQPTTRCAFDDYAPWIENRRVRATTVHDTTRAPAGAPRGVSPRPRPPVLLQPDENHSAPVTGSKPRRGFLSV